MSPTIPAGACCHQDGQCSQETESDCVTQIQGVFVGDYEPCTPQTCLGGCCEPDFGCTDGLDQGECAALDGLFFGVASECEPFADFCDGVPCDGPTSGDECDGSEGDIVTLQDGTTPFCTVNATEGNDTLSDQFGVDIWYDHCATCTGILVVSTCDSTVFAAVGIYGTKKPEAGCDGDANLLDYDLDSCPDQTDGIARAEICVDDVVHIRLGSGVFPNVGTLFGGEGNVTIECIPQEDGCQDADECAVATEVGDGTFEFCTETATNSEPAVGAGPAFCDFDHVFMDTWYAYEATCTGELTIRPTNDDPDQLMVALYDEVLDETCGDEAHLRTCDHCTGTGDDDDDCIVLDGVTKGDRFRVRVGSYGAGVTNRDSLQIDCVSQTVVCCLKQPAPAPPLMKRQPPPQTCVSEEIELHDCEIMGGFVATQQECEDECIGACCMYNGTCAEIPCSECDAIGNAVFLGPAAECPAQDGLCTRPCCIDGGAECHDDFTVQQCINDHDGTPIGDFNVVGGSCASSPCPGTAVCCLPEDNAFGDDECLVTKPSLCAQLGGLPVLQHEDCGIVEDPCDHIVRDCCCATTGECHHGVPVSVCFNEKFGTPVQNCLNSTQCAKAGVEAGAQCPADAIDIAEDECALRDGNTTDDGCSGMIGGEYEFVDATCDTYCGSLSTFNGTREADWYLITHLGGELRVTVRSDIPVVAIIVAFDTDDLCASEMYTEHIGCSDGGVALQDAFAEDLPPQQYAVVVATGTCDGTPIVGGFPCESKRAHQNYTLEIHGNCHDPGRPGACCSALEGKKNRYCVDGKTEAECHGEVGGVFQGGGSTCFTSQNECAALTGACCLPADEKYKPSLPQCFLDMTPAQCRDKWGKLTQFGGGCSQCEPEPLCVHISGRFFNDVNRNGNDDVGEQTISYAPVELVQNLHVIGRTYTDKTGTYDFGPLPPSGGHPYFVRAPAFFKSKDHKYITTGGERKLGPFAVDDCVEGEDHIGFKDFFYRRKYIIGGHVYDDKNGNGHVDEESDKPLKGVLVDVFNKDGSNVVTLITDKTGEFSIEGLDVAGSPYKFVQHDREGCVSVGDSDPPGTDNIISTVHATPGISVENLFFLDDCDVSRAARGEEAAPGRGGASSNAILLILLIVVAFCVLAVCFLRLTIWRRRRRGTRR